MSQHAVDDLNSVGCRFYTRAMQVLREANIPYLVGGAYSLERHAGIVRRTKDFDIFLMPEDIDRALEVLAREGYKTERTFSHWLAKAFLDDDLIDLIFSSGNGACKVDSEWFKYAVPGTVLGTEQLLCPAEESLWQKAFILERDRCDTADVAHLLRAKAECMDWDRLLRRFGDHWRVLYAHLVLFGFIYPSEAHRVPAHVMQELANRLEAEVRGGTPSTRVCHGTLLSATQYYAEMKSGRYEDARLPPHGILKPEQIDQWTNNFQKVIQTIVIPAAALDCTSDCKDEVP